MLKKNKEILFATDFSPAAKTALHTLMQLQQVYQANLSLVHVLPSAWRDWFSSGVYEKEALQRLQTWQQKTAPESNDPQRLFVKKGNVAEAILKTAVQQQAELIVMGGGSVDNQGRYRTGSTAESVVRTAQQSVWLCKAEKLNRIVCGIDGSEKSAKALQQAADLARHFSAELTIVYGLPRADFNPLGLTPAEVATKEEKFKQKEIERIEKFLEAFNLDDIKLEILYPWGKPSHIILDLAEDFDYDLVVVGATGNSRLKQVLMGSTAEKVLRYVTCSLLVVR